MEQFDLIFRGAIMGLLVLFALKLIMGQKNRWVALFGAVFVISILGYVWAPLAFRTFGEFGWGIPFYFAGHFVSWCIWMFALTLFDDGFRPQWYHWSIAVLFILFFAGRYLPEDMPGILFGESVQRDRFVLDHMLYLAVIVVTMVRVGAGFSADMVERRRRSRVFVIAGAALYALVVVTVELSLGAVPGGPELDLMNSVSIFILTLALIGMVLTLRADSLVDPGPKRGPAATSDGPDQADLLNIAKLKTFFEEDKGYLKEGLTISQLADSIGLPEYRARKLINQSLGFRNFNALLNEYRIKDACKALSDPEMARTPILTIALDCGYASLGPFNRAFKELTDMTPTEYRRKKLGSGLADS
ncbi:MAG: helix-turn-helix domain-containing protein [Alphaproteobacteria bacterium]